VYVCYKHHKTSGRLLVCTSAAVHRGPCPLQTYANLSENINRAPEWCTCVLQTSQSTLSVDWTIACVYLRGGPPMPAAADTRKSVREYQSKSAGADFIQSCAGVVSYDTNATNNWTTLVCTYAAVPCPLQTQAICQRISIKRRSGVRMIKRHNQLDDLLVWNSRGMPMPGPPKPGGGPPKPGGGPPMPAVDTIIITTKVQKRPQWGAIPHLGVPGSMPGQYSAYPFGEAFGFLTEAVGSRTPSLCRLVLSQFRASVP
jgi:hypothetical protein